MVRRFEDLAAWRVCVELCERIADVTASAEDHEFRRQILDAAESAPALIAEGFARFTHGEMIRYLRMARGELAEVQNDISRGRRHKIFSAAAAEDLATLARRAMGTTTNLLKAKLRQAEAEALRKRQPNQRLR